MQSTPSPSLTVVTDATRSERRARAVAPRPLTALLLIGVGRECERRVRAALAARDLKPRHVYVLDVLEREGPVGQRELGEMLDVDHSLLVTVLNPLESEGFIERRRSDQDRRRHHVLITTAGRRLLKQALSTIESVQADFLQSLDKTSEEELRQALETVRSGFVQGLGSDNC
jgi:DNA-binding MarR family transcriptional regulator